MTSALGWPKRLSAPTEITATWGLTAARNSGHVELLENLPDQQGCQGMQKDVHNVVTGRVGAPQPPFQPEHRVGQRPVVSRLGGEPDPLQPVFGLDDPGRGHVRVLVNIIDVVPDELASHGRDVRYQRGPDD